MGKIRDMYTISVGKPKWKRPFGKPRHRWEDNIKIYLRETVFGGVDYIHIAQESG
jgi:hypothetical protein